MMWDDRAEACKAMMFAQLNSYQDDKICIVSAYFLLLFLLNVGWCFGTNESVMIHRLGRECLLGFEQNEFV